MTRSGVSAPRSLKSRLPLTALLKPTVALSATALGLLSVRLTLTVVQPDAVLPSLAL